MITFNLLHFKPVGFQVLISQPNLNIGLVCLHNDVDNNEHKRTTAIYENKKKRANTLSGHFGKSPRKHAKKLRILKGHTAW